MMLRRPSAAGGAPGSGLFALARLKPGRVAARPERRRARPATLLGSGAVAAILLLGLAGWLARPWGEPAAAWEGLATIEPAAAPDPPGGAVDARAPDLLATAVRELEQRQAAFELRERDLSLREAALRKLAARLHAELGELQSLRRQRDEEQENLERQQEERVARLARLYESMKPKKAASILDGMPTEEVANIARRMRDGKAAAVIQQMAPEQASALSEQLSRR